MAMRAIRERCRTGWHAARLAVAIGPAARAAWLAVALALAGPALALDQPLDQQQVMAGAAVLYRERIDALRASRLLDDDAAFHARVWRIAQPLLAQAARDYPVAAGWPWEIHTSSDPEEHAYAMAGGRLLVSGAHAAALALSDAELAMVLAHEIAHAVLRHNLLEYEEALRLEPAWAARPFAALEHALDHDGALMAKLAPLNRQQELEADQAGLRLAARAGWPPRALAGYFRKLAQASAAPHAASFAHPAPATRWRLARQLADVLAAAPTDALRGAPPDARPDSLPPAQPKAQPKAPPDSPADSRGDTPAGTPADPASDPPAGVRPVPARG